jgi:hypothetical protein
MLQQFLHQVNLWAVLVATLVYFILGSLWFSVLFGGVWSREVEKLGILIKIAKGTIATKMFQTFFGMQLPLSPWPTLYSLVIPITG